LNITIRLAVMDDAQWLPAIEESAGNNFRTIPELAWVADDDGVPAEQHGEYIALGSEWVAANNAGTLIAFLAAEQVGSELHLWELAVHEDYQRQGIGARLLEAAVEFARQRQAVALTLTTFLDVPWNAPWYARLGFELVTSDPRLTALVRAETERGLPRRCAMRRVIR
jgi:GNAT superfamily N-acetyltransferase